MSNRNTIGQNIAHYRKKAGMTQEELSEKMNVTAQAVSKWECDQSYPDLESVRRLAAVLGTTADALLNGEEAAPPVKLAETEDPARRLLVISVNAKQPVAATVNLRLPLELVLRAHREGKLAELLGENASFVDMGMEAIEKGTVGPLVDVTNDGADVRIEVVDYDA